MSDTSKARARMAGMHVTNEKGEILLSLVPSNGRTLASGEANRAYHYVHEAVNSYNPERDRLARELAEMVTGELEWITLDGIQGSIENIVAKARQLLGLYKE